MKRFFMNNPAAQEFRGRAMMGLYTATVATVSFYLSMERENQLLEEKKKHPGSELFRKWGTNGLFYFWTTELQRPSTKPEKRSESSSNRP